MKKYLDKLTPFQQKLKIPFTNNKTQVTSYWCRKSYWLYNIPFKTQLKLIKTGAINSGSYYLWEDPRGLKFYSTSKMFKKIFKQMAHGKITGTFYFYKIGSEIYLDVLEKK